MGRERPFNGKERRPEVGLNTKNNRAQVRAAFQISAGEMGLGNVAGVSLNRDLSGEGAARARGCCALGSPKCTLDYEDLV